MEPYWKNLERFFIHDDWFKKRVIARNTSQWEKYKSDTAKAIDLIDQGAANDFYFEDCRKESMMGLLWYDGLTPLHIACKINLFEVVKSLILKYPNEIHR